MNVIDTVDITIKDGRLIISKLKVKKAKVSVDSLKKLNLKRRALKLARRVDKGAISRRVGQNP